MPCIPEQGARRWRHWGLLFGVQVPSIPRHCWTGANMLRKHLFCQRRDELRKRCPITLPFYSTAMDDLCDEFMVLKQIQQASIFCTVVGWKRLVISFVHVWQRSRCKLNQIGCFCSSVTYFACCRCENMGSWTRGGHRV